MKQLIKLGLFLLMIDVVVSNPIPTVAAADAPVIPLQQLIDHAKTGDTLVIPSGTYSGPVIIDKSLSMEAEQGGKVILLNESEEAAMQIAADNVSISGLRLVDTAIKENPTILITGDQVKLVGLAIRTGSYGIKFRDADKGLVQDSTIVWAGKLEERRVKLSDKGNGIDLYNSHQNHFVGNRVRAMHDGIYMENSDDNLVESNTFELLRYGVHCMYTKGTIIRNNSSQLNITGAMVMAVRNVELYGNTFVKQSENVNSQGILLFDAHGSKIHDNRVEGNRVGLYIEQSTENQITANQVIGNFVGIQLLETEKNQISGNQFTGNVADAEAKASSSNTIEGNYWDSFQGIDTNGDGSSEIAYSINPFFQGLIKSRPAFQLFFQSPGMVFLESLYQSDQEHWTEDAAPLMSPIFAGYSTTADAWKTGMLAVLLLCIALPIILLTGVKRK